MKQLIILFWVVMLCGCVANAQKINSCHYKIVDTLIQYKNAEIISYKNKNGKPTKDTVYYSKMKCDIRIETVDFMFVDETKKLKKIN